MATRDRRRKGEGSVYTRKSDGRGVAVADLGTDVEGRRLRRTFYGSSEAEAVAKRKAWLASPEAKREQRSGTSSDTVERTIDAFLDARDAAGNRSGTTRLWRSNLQAHVKPAIGNMKLNRVRESHIDSVQAKMQRAGVKIGVRRNVDTAMRALFRWTVARKLLAVSPMDPVPKPKAPDIESRKVKSVRVWTPEQARTFIAKTSARPFGTMFAFALRTGLRPGELYGLRWHSVDFERRTIHVEVALDIKQVLGPLKTKSSERTIEIDDDAIAILRVLRRPDGYVFRSRTGGPINESSARRALKTYSKAAGVPVRKPHELRHSHATFLLLDGVPPLEVAARLGHSSAVETLRTYAHFVPELAAAAKSIAKTLSL